MLPPGVSAATGDVLTPKKQAVVDRLRRRIENYRRRQTDFMPRFGQSFNGFCEQNIQETLLLKQKFLENKSKRSVKKQEKKQPEPVNNILMQQKFLKRPSEDDGGDFGESAAKHPCGGSSGATGSSQSSSQNNTARPTEGLTKFSVEIVQQLEFTTSTANSQPQQISTNVTVKALTNASVKEEPVRPSQPPSHGTPSPAPVVECKQEPDSEFVDLEQCAAALEKDAQNNSSFPGFSELIGSETSDDMISSDAFKDLISEISDFHPELMRDFDFGENSMKIEVDSKEGILPQSNYQQFDNNSAKSRLPSYGGLEFGKGEMSPAAQTLKQMAEQHQHKQMSMNFPSGRTPRSPYADYQFPPQGDYKNQSTNTTSGQADVKQEVNFSASQSQSFQANIKSPGSSSSGPKTPTSMMGGYKQPYSPYSSPGGHSSPGYMPRGQGPGPNPPRPPSAPNGPTVQMTQNQQMHINTQSPGPQIQVSAGQHMQLNSEMKAAVSIGGQQQQGMYFSSGGNGGSADATYNLSQSQTINFTQQSLRHRTPTSAMPPQQVQGLRPPPPDYKASPQQQQQQQQPNPMMHGMGQPRYATSGVRRTGPGQQPVPPSGPMMRPQMGPGGGMYMTGGGIPRPMQQGGAAGYHPRHRPPNISVGPDGLPLGPGRNPDGMPLGRCPESMGLGPGRGSDMGMGRVPDMGLGRSLESMGMGPGRVPESMGMGPGRVPESMGMGRLPESMGMGHGRIPDSMGMGPGRGPESMGLGPGRGPESMGLGPGRGHDGLGMGMGPGRGPDHMGLGPNREWRHVAMSQQQSAAFSSHGRTFNSHPGNFQMGNSGGNMQQMMPQMRHQMGMMPQNMLQPHVSSHNQMSMNVQMSQSQCMTLNTGVNSQNSMPFHMNPISAMQVDGGGMSHSNMSNGLVNSNSQHHTPDIGLEFLDNLTSDTHDLFNGLDSPSNFNINDIL